MGVALLDGNRKYTSSDVARLVGVSQATVSRAFNNPACVNKETLSRIIAAARELDYTPNAIAKSLVSQRTNIIGVILADITNPFYTDLMDRLSEALVAQGKKLLLFNGTKTTNLEEVLLEAVCFQADGLVIASSVLANQLLTCAPSVKNIPIVLINARDGSDQVCTVCGDNTASGALIADYLLDRGCRRFCYLGGPETMSSTILRWQGYRARLLERGVPEEDTWARRGEYSYAFGFEAAGELIPTFDGRRTGVFCGNDLIAMGAMDAIRMHGGLRIPEDVSLLGFDDIPQAAWHSYNLSTMHFPLDQMVRDTLDYLNGKGTVAAGLHLYPCKMVVRGSA